MVSATPVSPISIASIGEDAASGAGVASDLGAEKAIGGYTQQVEAFVQREDIPQEMKHGVKTYFKQIHNVKSEPEEEKSE